MSGFLRVLLALALLMPLAGCNFRMRRTLDNPGRSQTVRVESGERLYLNLEENATTGYLWEAACADPDVLVKIEHVPGESRGGRVGAPGLAKVEIRIHRGYDGPSEVKFRYRRSWEKTAAEEFVLGLYRRTGDCAFWK